MAFDDISIYFNSEMIIGVHSNEIISGSYESHAGLCVCACMCVCWGSLI